MKRKMALAGFKQKMRTGWEVEPIDLNVAYIPPPEHACNRAQVWEADQRNKCTGLTRRKSLKLKRPERTVPVLRVADQEGHMNGAKNLNQSAGELLQSQFETMNRTILSRSSHHPKISVAIKFPRRESYVALAPGTCVLYMPSLISKGYANAHTVEALSLLADVSCEEKRSHIERPGRVRPKLIESKGCVNARTVEALSLLADASCEVMRRRDILRARNVTSKFSGKGIFKKEQSDQLVPLKKKMASVLKKLNELKEQCTDKHTQTKITDSFKIVRKQRTPRGPSLSAYRWPTELHKDISLSKYDEVVSPVVRGSGAGCADITHWRDRLAMPGTSTITSKIPSSKDVLAMYEFSDNKSMPSVGSVPLTVKRTASVERVSKCLGQIRGAKKRPFGRSSTRSERFTNKILQFIGEMSLPEKEIRQALGNNPDTSKALRLLLAQRKVTRQGSGGRGRPFVYVASEKGRLHILGIQFAAREVVKLTPESVSSCNPISATSPIVSDAPTSDTLNLVPTQVTNTPEAASASDPNPSPPCSVTPHSSSQWPLAQTMNCVVSSQSFDLLSSGITEC